MRWGRRARTSGQDGNGPEELVGARFGRPRTPTPVDDLPEPTMTAVLARPTGARFPAEGRHRAVGLRRRTPAGWPFTAGHATAARTVEITPTAPPPGVGARGVGRGIDGIGAARFRPGCA